jgi:hypothetical protein
MKPIYFSVSFFCFATHDRNAQAVALVAHAYEPFYNGALLAYQRGSMHEAHEQV